MNVLENALAAFRELLRNAWTSVGEVATLAEKDAEEFRAAWAQANWEIIVEAALSPDGRLSLEIYGDGADCNGASSRVWRPDALPTHAVHCVPRTGNTAVDRLMGELVVFPEGGLLVDRFVSQSEDGWYVEMPPFDCVLVDSAGRQALFRLDELSFQLQRLG